MEMRVTEAFHNFTCNVCILKFLLTPEIYDPG